MFVWYENSQGTNFRFFVHSNIRKETAINEKMKGCVYSQDGTLLQKRNFEVKDDNGKKYFEYDKERVYFDDFIYIPAEKLVECLEENVPLEDYVFYATLEKESVRLQFLYNNKTYTIIETPYLRKDLARVIYLTDGKEKLEFFFEEFILFLKSKQIVPKTR